MEVDERLKNLEKRVEMLEGSFNVSLQFVNNLCSSLGRVSMDPSHADVLMADMLSLRGLLEVVAEDYKDQATCWWEVNGSSVERGTEGVLRVAESLVEQLDDEEIVH